jgi:hypothetical protein
VRRRIGRPPTLTRLPDLTGAAVAGQLTDLYTAYGGYRGAPTRELPERLAEWSARLDRCGVWLWSTAAHGLVGDGRKVSALVAVGWTEALPWQSAAIVRDDGSTVWLADLVRLVFPVSGRVEPTDERPFPPDAVVVSGPAGTGELAGDSSDGAWYGTLEGDLVAGVLSANRIGADDLGALPASLEASSVAHFSCHGRLDHENPGRSSLMLDGGIGLSANEVANLDLRGLRLVFLSACETAAVRPLSSDAPEGLAHAFLAAGMTCVIGSRWIVSDASSMVLALEFYERWVRGGLPAGEALHEAQRWLRTASGYELALQLAPHVDEANRHVQ